MQVTCLYSPGPRHILQVTLHLADGATVMDALQILQTHAQFDTLPEPQHVGIWGRKALPTATLKEGDRLEIYRPLLVDPQFARKQRFKRQGKGRTGLFARRRVGAVAGY